ncbi:MAG: lipid droplet-associated protein [Actinomycetota bacterium]|nr:lipid droplet-associated protein [Actinomycetota bacterium]
MSPLPLPVRLAAGLVVTAVDQARKLPTQLATLPITAVSRALQVSMRVQQRVTELAIKGDEAFASFRSVDDTPPWARFDEDGDGGRRDDTPPATARTRPGEAANRRSGRAATNVPVHTPADVPVHTPADVPADVPAEIDEADVAQALTPHPPATGADNVIAGSPAVELTPEVSDTLGASSSGSGPPPALPGYDELSLAQLRAKLRTLSAEQLEALLEHEQHHQNRAPFITMLANRITTVRSR